MGVALQQVSVGRVRELLVPLAPLSEQERIEDTLDALTERVAVEVRKFEALRRLKRGLLDALLSGKRRSGVSAHEEAA
jgi:type I restriction enzyme S subunit